MKRFFHYFKRLIPLILIPVLLTIMISMCGNRIEEDDEEYFPRLGNYADFYLRGTYDILHMIKVRELEKIGTAAKIAAQRKINGGKIISAIGTPHIMYGGACDSDIPGNPGTRSQKWDRICGCRWDSTRK